jgi:hypothetical protein
MDRYNPSRARAYSHKVFVGMDYSELPIAQPQLRRGMNIFYHHYFQAEGLSLGSPRSRVSTCPVLIFRCRHTAARDGRR